MHVHVVFVTKFRHKVFTDRHLTRGQQIMRDVCRDFEAELVEFNSDNNHSRIDVQKSFRPRLPAGQPPTQDRRDLPGQQPQGPPVRERCAL